jgi:hypothetical protein
MISILLKRKFYCNLRLIHPNVADSASPGAAFLARVGCRQIHQRGKVIQQNAENIALD